MLRLLLQDVRLDGGLSDQVPVEILAGSETNTSDPMTNPNELLREYQALRQVQKAYFKNRSQGDLELAKGMERELDKKVKDYFEEKAREKYGKQETFEL